MRECECERVPKRTYINYLLLLLEGGKRGRQERASEKNYHTQLERRSSKETSGCEKFIEHKIQKKSQENLRRNNLSGN